MGIFKQYTSQNTVYKSYLFSILVDKISLKYSTKIHNNLPKNVFLTKILYYESNLGKEM